ncbi:PAAR motif protein [Actinoplanes italicus]|uniref:PAAR motif-containing protein n=1 Tax=Actinoplanes italicus TaxID=113567 RepID=A0A2T0K370_9ACTN|nr:PAAR domain-containing protein [Actinoplanes italicus]PRX17284.1 PAAR motif-containing protein [Actinoplanes italicus]GIE35158.1 PAAR motif protein [Actinoplanes italicus]
MGSAAATEGDRVTGTDTHLVIPSSGGPPVPTPAPFSGRLDGGLSSDVRIGGRAAAVVGSTVTNSPGHVPSGGTFAVPPRDSGTVAAGSATVRINGKPAARSGDTVLTCNDPVPLPAGTIAASGAVTIG